MVKQMAIAQAIEADFKRRHPLFHNCGAKGWVTLAFPCQSQVSGRSGQTSTVNNQEMKMTGDKIWTKDQEKIIAVVKRGHQVLDSIH